MQVEADEVDIPEPSLPPPAPSSPEDSPPLDKKKANDKDEIEPSQSLEEVLEEISRSDYEPEHAVKAAEKES